MTDKKTRAELVVLADRAYEDAPTDGHKESLAAAVDALIETTGYEPAPPAYAEGSIARVTTRDRYVYICERRDGKWWFATSRSLLPEYVERVEPMHIYDPASALVVPLDKVPTPSALNEGRIVADSCALWGVARFLNEVRALAEQYREGK